MSETEYKITDIKTLRKSLIHLCSSNNFHNEISDLKDALDLPTKFDHADMKALLIRAVVDCFGEKSFETDAVLMEFGLSSEKGLGDNLFEHDSDTEESRLCARRKEFLKISNYIYRTRNSRKKYKFNTYEEMVKLGKDAIDTTIETLGNRNGGYIEAVAKKIYTKRNDKNFIESRKEYLEGSGKARKVKPPPMTNFRDNSSSQTQGREFGDSITHNENTEDEKTSEADYNGTQSNVTIIYDNKTYQEITINNAETNQDVKIDNTEINPEIDIDIHEDGDTGSKAKVYDSESKVTGKLKPILLFFMIVLVGLIIALICLCVPKLLNNANTETIMGNYYSAVSGWNDNYNKDGGRPNYSTSQVEAGALDNEAVFNSLSDNEQFDGNENYFIRVCEYDESNQTPIWQAGNITIKDGQEYLVRLYIHNNSPRIAAKDVKTFFSIGNASNKTVSVTGFIKSSNANPTEYSSTFIFNSDTAFCLEYIPNSATLLNQGIGDGGIFLGDQIVSDDSGTLIGYNALDGIIPGGIEYASYVTIRVKAVVMDYEIEQQVRLAGTKEWIPDEITAEVGDKVEFQLQYKNTAENDIVHRDVMVGATLPDSLKYVPGSTKIWNETYDGSSIDQDTIVTTGVNIGHYAPGENAFVRFTAEVVDENLADGSNVLVAWGRTTVAKFVLQDSARVRVENGKPTDNKIVLVAPICILSLLIIAIIAILIMLLRKSKQPK